jgi:hypothetical protein
MSFIVEKLLRYRDRAMAAFIMDDLSGALPEDAAAFKRFSQWVCEAGLTGECSVILGLRRTEAGKALPLAPGFAQDLLAAKDHLDPYMEVMTHSGLYDFAADRIREGSPHEGIWLLDRSRPLEEYVEYFRHIAARAHAEGIRHAGLTLPGCGCQPCADFYTMHRIRWNAIELSPMVNQALLQVMSEGLLAGSACGVFVGSDVAGPADTHLLDERGAFGVYDLPPGVEGDHFGRWDNDPAYRDPDFYITPDGQGGRLPQLLAQGTRTLIYYGHWQSLRPDRGIGFQAFGEVAARLNRHHAGRIVWMRPSQIAAYRHTERHTEVRPAGDGAAGAGPSEATSRPKGAATGPQSFELRIPFAPLHPVSFRVSGGPSMGPGVRIRTPDGKVLSPVDRTDAGAIFDLLPANGRYDILA